MKYTRKRNKIILRDESRIKLAKTIVGISLVFALGLFVGNNLDFSYLTSIQGFLYNSTREGTTDSKATSTNATSTNATSTNATSSNATSSNATSTNATSSNATSSNATSTNATSSNATSSNAEATDNILYLVDLKLDKENVKLGEKVNVIISSSGACTSGGTMLFKNITTNASFSTTIESIENKPYITIPNNIIPGTYELQNIILMAKNSDNSTFSRTWLSNTDNLLQNKKLVIAQNTEQDMQREEIKLTEFKLNTKETTTGGKVSFEYKSNYEIQSMMITLKGADEKTIDVYALSLNTSPYFEVPTATPASTYNVIRVTIKTAEDMKSFYYEPGVMGTQYYPFNSTVIIKQIENQKTFVYNNENINQEIITKLYQANQDAVISINADSNPILSEELFNTIKGTNKKLIINYHDNKIEFTGKDITVAKSIDVSISTNTIEKSSAIGKLVKDGIVLNFADNGVLPGNATVKIKITDEMSKKLNNKIYVYFYNESCDDFSVIAKEIKEQGGYYEFTIEHNSQYLLVSKKLPNKLLADERSVHFQKSDIVNLLLIGLGFLLAGVVIIIIIYAKKKTDVEKK